MTFGPVQDLVDSLADRLGRSVAVEDHTLDLVAYSKDYGDADTARVVSLLNRRSRPDDVYYARLRAATEPMRVEENLELDLYARLAIPIRYQSMLLGFIWLIDRHHTLTEEEINDSVAAAHQLAGFLHRRLVVRDSDDAQIANLIERVVHGEATDRATAVADVLTLGYLDDDSYVAVVAVRFLDALDDRSVLPAAVQSACRPMLPRTWVSRSNAREATVILARRRPPTEEARSIAEALRKHLRDVDRPFHIGVSSIRQGLADASACMQQAEIAISVARRRGSPADIACWDELGPYRLIGQLPSDLVTNPLVPHGVFRFLRSNDAGQLLSTAEVFLDCGGDKQKASQLLRIHRSTMYYRLDRIASITGLDLDDGNDRLLLHLAIKLWRLDPPTPPAAD